MARFQSQESKSGLTVLRLCLQRKHGTAEKTDGSCLHLLLCAARKRYALARQRNFPKPNTEPMTALFFHLGAISRCTIHIPVLAIRRHHRRRAKTVGHWVIAFLQPSGTCFEATSFDFLRLLRRCFQPALRLRRSVKQAGC